MAHRVSNRSFAVKSIVGRDGLTLVELLAVLAVIGVLVAISLVVIGRVRDSALRAHCTSNLRQIGVALTAYANDNRGALPDNSNHGAWAWDVRYDIIERLGRPADIKGLAYCPAGHFPDKDLLWEFQSGPKGFRAIGYVLLLRGTPSVPDVETNATIDGGVVQIGEMRIVVNPPAQRVLAADATISFGYGNFTEVRGMAPTPHRANHLSGDKPSGGNVLFLDGHVAWRPFAEMKNRAIAPTAWFWW